MITHKALYNFKKT